jgi:hypothetical protein
MSRFTLSPVCQQCGRGSLLLMPKRELGDAPALYCLDCQAQVPLDEVLYVQR